MSITIEIPKAYGYIIITATATFLASTWHALRIGQFRKAAGRVVRYPVQYASNQDLAAAETEEQRQALYLFNCAQRAHYNFLENYTTALPAMLIGGIVYPKTAAATGAVWLAFRIVYALGYTRSDRSDGKGRLAGSGFWAAQAVLSGIAGIAGFRLLI